MRRTKVITAKSTFENQLDALGSSPSATIKALPLTHLTDWAGFLAIAADGKFASKKACRVYRKHLAIRFMDDQPIDPVMMVCRIILLVTLRSALFSGPS
jgi:hypothetical protein